MLWFHVLKAGASILKSKKFTIICGHYGCGKTNLSINMAIDSAAEGHRVTLVDFDIVNPYFRSSDYAALLEGKGIRVIAPLFARSTIDLPMLAPEIHSVFENKGTVIVDVGGDDVGATVLGRFADRIKAMDYDMLYVINRYRALSTKVEEATELLYEIENASHLKATAIVNNSHVMQDTTARLITESFEFADKVSKATRLPVRFTAVPRFLEDEIPAENIYPVDVYVGPPWMVEEDWGKEG